MARGMGTHRMEKGICLAVLGVMTALTVLSVSFSSIYYILISGVVGIVASGMRKRSGK